VPRSPLQLPSSPSEQASSSKQQLSMFTTKGNLSHRQPGCRAQVFLLSDLVLWQAGTQAGGSCYTQHCMHTNLGWGRCQSRCLPRQPELPPSGLQQASAATVGRQQAVSSPSTRKAGWHAYVRLPG
jgi:hypothetical protein